MKTLPARAVLLTGCALHFLHDGFADLLYVLFPIWARELSLSFVEVGFLRTGYSGALALFQIPAGFLAERLGEPRILAAGTVLTALGFLFLGTAGSFWGLVPFLILAGVGSGTQHPLSSSLVSRAFEGGRRRVAIGTYNFSGDLGKTAWPAIIALASGWAGWRQATSGVGLVALAAGLIAFAMLRTALSSNLPSADAMTRPESAWGIRHSRGFKILSAIHGIDNGSRTAFMTYLPFLVLAKGGGIDLVGAALALTFAGGALGKFLCGAVAERLGIIRTVILTEAATVLGMLLVVALPLQGVLLTLPLLGVALNGTSSVLYGTVAELVLPERRSRAYGLFYTIGIGSGAAAPPLFGLLSDRAGVATTLSAIGLMVLLTLPLAGALRPAVEAAPVGGS